VTGWTIPKGKAGIGFGIAAIILGIGAIIVPVLAFALIEYFFAAFAVITSAGLVMTGLDLQKENKTQGLLLAAAGILGVLAGCAIIVAPRFMAVTALTVLGIWTVIAGASDLLFVFTSITGMERSIKAVTGILMLITGILILIAPALVTGFLLVVVVGIFAIATGILTVLFNTAKPAPEKKINHLIYK